MEFQFKCIEWKPQIIESNFVKIFVDITFIPALNQHIKVICSRNISELLCDVERFLKQKCCS